jgi:hypothetical protein
MQFWYIFPLLLITIINGYLSTKVNISRTFFYLLILCQIIPLWPFVARSSSNIILDAMIYDFLVVVIYASSLLYFTDMPLKPNLIIGVILSITGILLISR